MIVTKLDPVVGSAKVVLYEIHFFNGSYYTLRQHFFTKVNIF